VFPSERLGLLERIHDEVTAQFVVLDEAAAGTQSECIVNGHAISSKDT